MQDAEGPNDLGIIGQSDDATKSFAVVQMEEMEIGERDLFSSVKFRLLLVSPSFTLPKFWLPGVSVTAAEFEPFRWKPHPIASARKQERTTTAEIDPVLR